MSKINILPHDYEVSIRKFITKMSEEHNIKDFFPNPLLRDDVLSLLDLFCTVVYFPVNDAKNNGFHMTDMPFADGSKNNFVFINTAQTIEKQVFTAAHELGHIWKVDDFVISDLSLQEAPGLREDIINRFAATLLIPEDMFKVAVAARFKEYCDEEERITFINFLKIIVILMNQFFVPEKAVVFRLVETGFLDTESAEVLLGYKDIPIDAIESLIKMLISEFGYVQFQTSLRKKWISGLAEKLDIAEKNNLVPKEKIEYLRKQFGLHPAKDIAAGMESVLTITAEKGIKENVD